MKKLVSLLFVFLFSQYSFAQALGDYMDIDGVPGFVFYLDESGEHGMVMSFSAMKKIQLNTFKKMVAKGDMTKEEVNAMGWEKLILPEKSALPILSVVERQSAAPQKDVYSVGNRLDYS